MQQNLSGRITKNGISGQPTHHRSSSQFVDRMKRSLHFSDSLRNPNVLGHAAMAEASDVHKGLLACTWKRPNDNEPKYSLKKM